MGILDVLRGRKKKEPSPGLPVPTPVTVYKEPIPSDIPIIRAAPDPKEELPLAFEALPASPRESPESRSTNVKHVFVSSDEYSSIIEKTDIIRSKLLESDEALQKLEQLKTTEEEELLKWLEQLESLEKKISYVETVLAKSGET